MKQKLEELKELKVALTVKEESEYKLKQRLDEFRSIIESLKKDLEFEKLKALTMKNTMLSNSEIELENTRGLLNRTQKMT